MRARSGQVFDYVAAGKSRYFSLNLGALPDCAEFVDYVTARHYPSGEIPYHSRWRHFEVSARDRWADWCSGHPELDSAERTRAAIDLAVVSVLLDAGAGPDWSYREAASGTVYARSEGLAVASFDWFSEGGLSSAANHRVDADALTQLTESQLRHAFQVTADNPLLGCAGRVALLNRLGHRLQERLGATAQPAPRIADLFKAFTDAPLRSMINAAEILTCVLFEFGPIWPNAVAIDGITVGDAGRHSALTEPGPTRGWVPFHKLSQWLTYSLIEPLEWAGLSVSAMDGLTGLAEYRNGGLFIDSEVLQVCEPDIINEPQYAASEAIVEWRALTVTLLDRLAGHIRRRRGLDSIQLPLARILQGGTWNAGRELAATRRADASPPIRLHSDGTVF